MEGKNFTWKCLFFPLTKEKMGVSEAVGLSLLCYLLARCGVITLHISRLLGDTQPIS